MAMASASPTPRPTSDAIDCPTTLAFAVDGPAVDLDLGTTGINYDTPFSDGLVLRFDATCPERTAADCGVCTLTGPVQIPGEVPTRRCLLDTRVVCSIDADCPEGACVDLFGPLLPLSAGGAPSCVQNQIVAAGPGSFAPGTGETTLPLTLRWHFFEGIDVGVPCPTCSAAALGAVGVCRGGPADGAACTVHATDALLGNTSYDCPPNRGAFFGVLDYAMTLTTGTSSLPRATPCASGTDLCYCPGQAVRNDCTDAACSGEPDRDGVCAGGPMDLLCAREPFRGCLTDADCPAAGDHCAGHLRECPAGGDAPVVRVGRASASSPLLVSTFCVERQIVSVLNEGLGLPGPAAIRMPLERR